MVGFPFLVNSAMPSLGDVSTVRARAAPIYSTPFVESVMCTQVHVLYITSQCVYVRARGDARELRSRAG